MATASTLWVCWAPPPRQLTGAAVISFLRPSLEERLVQAGLEVIRAREASRPVRQDARRLYQEIVARLGTVPGPNGLTFRQALARPGEASRWWYHPVTFRDCESDPTFDRLIAILTIQAVARQRGAVLLVLCGGAPEIAQVLRSEFQVDERATTWSPPAWWAYVRGLGSRVRYAATQCYLRWLIRRLKLPTPRPFTVGCFGFWDWSVWWDAKSRTLTDRYLKSLPRQLQDAGAPVGWLAWCDPQTPVRAWWRSLAMARDSQSVVLLQGRLSAQEILTEVFDARPLLTFLAWRRRHAFRAAFRERACDYYPLFASALLRGFANVSLAHCALIAHAVVRVCQRYRPSVLLSVLEHHLSARAAYAGAKRSAGTVTCGAIQHASYNHEKTFVFLDPVREFLGHPDGCAVPHSDHVCVMGALGRAIFEECGYPSERVVQTGSPRYGHVTAPSSRLSAVPVGRSEALRLLLALSLDVEAELDLVDAVCAAVEGWPDVQVMVRNHPFSQIERLPAFAAYRDHVTLTHGALEEDVEHADVVLFTYSTVAEEAFLQGKTVWQWLPLGFDGSALAEAIEIPRFGSIPQLRDALQAFRIDPARWRPSVEARQEAFARLFASQDDSVASQITGWLRAVEQRRRGPYDPALQHCDSDL